MNREKLAERVVGLGPDEEGREGSWICTVTGRRFWPLDPRPEDFHIQDIAHALSNQCRFLGHTSEFYSVAQHSVMVAKLVLEDPEIAGLPDPWRYQAAMYALMHDGPEAYIGDLSRPTKHKLDEFRRMEHCIEWAMCEWLGLRPTNEIFELVKEKDNIMLRAEALSFMPPSSIEHWHWDPVSVEGAEKVLPLTGLTPLHARKTFLNIYAAIQEMGA